MPTISALPDVAVDQNSGGVELGFAIGDVETLAGSLMLNFSSSNEALVPRSSVILSGSGASRSVQARPATNQHGSTVISVHVSDGTATTTESFTLTVNELNSAPALVIPDDVTLAENTGAENTGAVLIVSATDADAAPGSLVFSITGAGADDALFVIDEITGALSFAVAPDFEAPRDADHDNVYAVEVAVSDGELSSQQVLNVRVTDLSLSRTITLPDTVNAVLLSRDGQQFVVMRNSIEFFRESFDDVVTVTLQGGSLADSVAAIGSLAELNVTTWLLDGGGDNDRLDLSVAGIRVTLRGAGGNDTLIGGSQADGLEGNEGDDVLTGGLGTDLLTGGLGNDTLREMADFGMTLTSTSLMLSRTGQASMTDVLSGFEAAFLTGGAGANFIDAGGFVVGTGLGVTLVGGGGNDVINGGSGNDSLVGDDGDDVINAGGGNDVVLAGAGRDSVTGGAGADSLLGGDGFDTVFGGTSNDTIDGGLGNDVLNGQDGDDSILGGSGNDKLTGAAGNDVIDGGLNDDVLNGDAGTDTLLGRDGADVLVGGDDGDRLEGEAGADRLRGDKGLDTLLGGAGSDNISGGADADLIDGGDDNDSLFGDFGNDTVLGGAGDDQLRGHEGQDVIDGGSGTGDKVSEDGDTSFTIIGLRIVSALCGDETPLNVERFNLSGGAGNNLIDGRLSSVRLLLNGLSGNDTLLGGAFVDNIFGGDGDDVLSGGGSNDVIDGGVGSDFFYEKANANVTITGLQVVSVGISPSVGTGTETLIGIERIALVGGDGANDLNAAASSVPVILLGGKGNDSLIGSNSNDVLVGGNRADSAAGADTLVGGSGADVFDNDAPDSRTTDVTDSVIATVFAAPFPSWLDLI